MTLSVGVDVGGTFTDLVCVDASGRFETLKVPTTKGAPQKAVMTALERIAARGVSLPDIARFAHGTTVATNAVLERKGGPIGLLLTEGFRDILEIGRSYRPSIYDMFPTRTTPEFLASGARVQVVPERIGPTGEVWTAIDEAALRQAVATLIEAGVNAIAVSFLFSFANPEHELAARQMIEEMAPDVLVSLSHEVDPMFREYERTCITAFDAYVKPLLVRYLAEMADGLADLGVPAPLQVMQSRGGLTTATVASQRPVRLFLSGPAGGVIGAAAAGRLVDEPDLISFDVGGTSCDIALIQGGAPVVKNTASIDGFTVRVPMVDVNAIGAGGGSIAWIDPGGGLRVGPHSAGSEPGPACYGAGGDEATVTDASVVLGYIDPAYFAGGTMRLDPDLSHAVIERRVARPLGLGIREAALGIHRVLNAQMAEGIRLVSVQRGIDPRRFALVPLGGGGGLHALPLARELGMQRVVVPRLPGVLAACGLLAAPIEHEVATALNTDLDRVSAEMLRTRFAALDDRCRALMQQEGDDLPFTIGHFLDVCYVGQAHWLEVPLDPAWIASGGDVAAIGAAFCRLHEQVHGHGEGGPTRIVNLRAVASVVPSVASATPDHLPSGAPARRGERMIVVEGYGQPLRAALYDRAALAVGETFPGPAIVEQADTTTLLEPGWTARVGSGGTLLMAREEIPHGIA